MNDRLKSRDDGVATDSSAPASGGQKNQWRIRRISRWKIALMVTPVLALLVFLAAKPAGRLVKNHRAKSLASDAQRYIDMGRWPDAAVALMKAGRWNREHTSVLRTQMNFLTLTRVNLKALVQVGLRLETLGLATDQDLLQCGLASIEIGDLQTARKLHERWVQVDGENRYNLELQSMLLRQAGRQIEADQVLRRSLALNRDDPQAQLRLALMDYSNRFPEVRAQALASLWRLATGPHSVALNAIEFLANTPDLTEQKVERLLRLVEAHPSKNPTVRLPVLSALIRLNPSHKAEVIESELKHYAGFSVNKLLPVIQWLATESQHDRILDLVPTQDAMTSREIFPFLAQALAQGGRWTDLRDLLKDSQSIPVARGRTELWMAEVASHLQPDEPERAANHLRMAFESASNESDHATVMLTAQVAERLGQFELALRCSEYLASHLPERRVAILEKIYELASHLKDVDRMLSVSRELVKSQPGQLNQRHQERLWYLELLLGFNLERINDTLRHSQETSEGGVGLNDLVRSLAAFRLRDMNRLMQETTELPGDPTVFSPGQRAVVAALLQHCGRETEAYRLIESLPAAALLPEEAMLLKPIR